VILYAPFRIAQEQLPKAGTAIDTQPNIIPRPDHNISRSNISPNAVKVLYRLKQAGFQAHLVGGGVRDLLLGREPKDFDVATDALPEQVKDLFRNCRLIGRRFRLAHVHFGREIIEVATFRAMPKEDAEGLGDHVQENGRILRDNVYGNIEEDAWRRDFTVNALYYDIRDYSVVDYTGGMEDIRSGTLRLIGDPATRYREDPVRMLRAVRFAVKLGFRMHKDTEEPIFELAPLLRDIPAARLFDETLKLFLGGQALETFESLRHYGLFRHLFPLTDEALSHEDHQFPLVLVSKALQNTDQRIAEGKPVTPAFLFAALLWEPTRLRAEALMDGGVSEHEALQEAADEVIRGQTGHISLPRRYSQPMKEIWFMQPRLRRRSGQRPLRLIGHPRFRAGYDFLLLRAQSGEAEMELADWWTRFQDMDDEHKRKAVQGGMGKGKGKGSRRRRRRRKRKASSGDAAG